MPNFRLWEALVERRFFVSTTHHMAFLERKQLNSNGSPLFSGDWCSMVHPIFLEIEMMNTDTVSRLNADPRRFTTDGYCVFPQRVSGFRDHCSARGAG